MVSLKKSVLSPRFAAVLVAALLVLSFIPTSDGPAIEALLSGTGVVKVGQSAQKHIEAQREQALKGFLLLSALKVGLAVLRSSEVGFILNVRIGDLAVAVYDYVNFAWKVLLAAVAYYYIAGYLLELASVVNIWFLWAALLAILAWLLIVDLRPESPRLRSVFSRSSLVASLLALLLYAGLPLSLTGAAWVSSHITGKPIADANLLYEDMGQTMPSLLDEGPEAGVKTGGSQIRTSTVTVPFPYDGSDPGLAITETPEGSRDRDGLFAVLISKEKLSALKKYLEQRSRALASAALRQTAAYLFNIVCFPLLMLAAFYFSFKYLLSLALMK